jgi:hypothetical protein
MTTSGRFVPPFFIPVDGSGKVTPGAKLYFYVSETSTPKNTFNDADLTVENPNPVPANGAGRFPDIFLEEGRYKVILKNADDTLVWTADPVSGSNSFTGGAFDSVADLRAYTGPGGSLSGLDNGSVTVLTGYYEAGDYGGSDVWWDDDSTEADDGGTVFKPNSVAGGDPGRWKRLVSGEDIAMEWFGIKGDGITADTFAVQFCLNYQRDNGGRITVRGDKRIRITSQLNYVTSTAQHGPHIQGGGMGSTVFLYDFANGRSFLKVRGTSPSVFMTGGGLLDFTIETPLNEDSTPKYAFWSQQCALDLGNWIEQNIQRVAIQNVRGHGIWCPTQFVSVNNLGGAVDRPNDKPQVLAVKASKYGRPADLLARIDSSTGAVTGFLVRRQGSGFADGAAVYVKGCGSGFAGTVYTNYNTIGTYTNATNQIFGVPNVVPLQIGNIVTGTNIPANTTVTNISGTTVTISKTPTGSATNGAINFAAPGGGLMGVTITTPGSGYYEENDHLFDNEDTFTCGLTKMENCQIFSADGVGLFLGHFASSGWQATSNYILNCAMGAIWTSGNANSFVGNAPSANGQCEELNTWWPGAYARRTWSTPNNTKFARNEFDSNNYAHILLDGTTGTQIDGNRFNSWVTFRRKMTSWTEQIPLVHIKFETGNTRATNTTFEIVSNAHRWQNAGASVPSSACTVVNGDPVITGIVPSPLASTTFIVGARIQILNASGVPITFGGGAAPETTITVVDNVAHTLTLADDPNESVAGNAALVRVIINEEFVLFHDFGRDVNTGAGQIRDIYKAAVPHREIEAANFRSQDNVGAAFDWTQGSFRKRGSPGLTAAQGRLVQDAIVSIADGPTPTIIPWTAVLDPESKLEIITPALPALPYYSGRYNVDLSGIYEVVGGFTLKPTAPAVTIPAGVTLAVDAVGEWRSIDTAGVVDTTNRSTSRRHLYTTRGLAAEAVQFTLPAAVSVYLTYIGVNAPEQLPSVGETGLIWWNPIARNYKRWNGATLAWENVTGTFNAPFDLDIKLSVQVLHDGADPLLIDTSATFYNSVIFKRVG